MRQRDGRVLERARTGGLAGGGRSAHAAVAAQDNSGAGAALCRIAGARRAEPRKNRVDCFVREGARVDLMDPLSIRERNKPSQKGTRIEKVTTSVYTIPTSSPEADGTFAWNSTTIVLAEVSAGGKIGIGYTYADAAAAHIIEHLLEPSIRGMDAMSVPECWSAMVRAIRNQGRAGICSMAIAAVDTALWDLKARLLGVPLPELFGRARDSVPLYGSGGFTSYSIPQLRQQLAGRVSQGIPRVKMKIGSHPERDFERVKAARDAVGKETELFVDANGAYSRKQALAQAEKFAQLDV